MSTESSAVAGASDPPPEVMSQPSSEHNTVSAGAAATWMTGRGRPVPIAQMGTLSNSLNAATGRALSSYMGEVLGTEAGLQRYVNVQRGASEVSPKGMTRGFGAVLVGHAVRTDYDESLAMMTRSPDHRVPYNRLTSLFEAAEAMEAMQRAAEAEEQEQQHDEETVPFAASSSN